MVHNIRLADIDYGLRAGMQAVEALRTWVKGAEAYRICSERERAIQDAVKALDKLSSQWSQVQSALDQRARDYDAYVIRDRSDGGCSCHISAPCGYCTSQEDEEAA